MKLFAPVAFRYPVNTGVDYPYGYQEIANDTLARLLLDAGLLVASDPSAQTDTNKRPLELLTVAQAAAVAPVYIGPWSGRPAASSCAAGSVMINTDLAVSGRCVFVSDGTTYWRYQTEVVLAANANAGTTSSSTTETVLATIAIQPYLLANNGECILELAFLVPNNTNSKTLNVRLGGTGVNGTVMWTNNMNATGIDKFFARVGFANYATGNQVQTGVDYAAGLGGTSTTLLTAAVDTTVAQNIYVTGQCSVGTDTITLQRIRASVR